MRRCVVAQIALLFFALAGCVPLTSPETAVSLPEPAAVLQATETLGASVEPTGIPLVTPSDPSPPTPYPAPAVGATPTAPPATTRPPSAAPPTGTPSPTAVPTVTAIPTASDLPLPAATRTSELAAFLDELETALATQDYERLRPLMADMMYSGWYATEWGKGPAEGLIESLQERWQPFSATAVRFTELDEAAIAALIDHEPRHMAHTPEGYATAVHSAGWGEHGYNEAILVIYEQDGRYVWQDFVFNWLRFGEFAGYDREVNAPRTLIYLDADLDEVRRGYFRGQSEQILDWETTQLPNIRVAPDGQHAAWITDDGQLWLLDTASGERRPLGAELRFAPHLHWGNSRTLLAGVWSTPEEADGPNMGHLTRIDLSDPTPRILDPQRLLRGFPALAPDGMRIAYGVTGRSPTDSLTARVYDLDEGPLLFDRREFVAQSEMQAGGLDGPAWSPDGRRLAWLALDGERVALQVYDLVAKTAVQLGQWPGAGFGGPLPAPVWSPDGAWLALQVVGNEPEENGLWLWPADGGEALLLDEAGVDPFWMEDGRLIFDAVGQQRVYDPVSGERTLLSLPFKSVVLAVGP